MERHRGDRLQRQIRAELSALIAGEIDDPRVGNVIVTDVQLSRDLGHARVFVHSIDGKDKEKALLEGLDSARGFLRRQLSYRLTHLRRTPELSFSYDRSIEAGTRIEKLLSDMDFGD